MAPTNWFQDSKKGKRRQDDNEVIVLDSDSVVEIEDTDVEMVDAPSASAQDESDART